MKKNIKIIIGLIIVVTFGVAVFLLQSKNEIPIEPISTRLDSFASCLSLKQITMYGAAWCSHCQAQKKLFGDSFRLVPYVECPENIKICLAKGIESYPTWLLPDGRKLVGEQSLEKLSLESSCPLPTAGDN